MQEIRQYLIVVVLALSLAALACGSSDEPTPSRTATATEAPDVAPRSDATNTPQTPTRVPRPTPTPTRTRHPTWTPRPTSTRGPTRTPLPTKEATPTRTRITGSVTQGVNLRAGPGTNYDKVGGLAAGEEFAIMGRTEDGEWYCVGLGSGEVVWIAAFLVATEAEEVPVVQADQIPPTPTIPPATNTPRPTNTTLPTSTSVPPTDTPQPVQGKVIIKYVYFDGQVPRVESDEYAEISNTGGASVNIGGWRLNAGDPGQDFVFPSFDLQPGQSCRVYTNEHHPEHCGFSYGSGRAIWNNKGDCGHLFDASGTEVSTYCY